MYPTPVEYMSLNHNMLHHLFFICWLKGWSGWRWRGWRRICRPRRGQNLYLGTVEKLCVCLNTRVCLKVCITIGEITVINTQLASGIHVTHVQAKQKSENHRWGMVQHIHQDPMTNRNQEGRSCGQNIQDSPGVYTVCNWNFQSCDYQIAFSY